MNRFAGYGSRVVVISDADAAVRFFDYIKATGEAYLHSHNEADRRHEWQLPRVRTLIYVYERTIHAK